MTRCPSHLDPTNSPNLRITGGGCGPDCNARFDILKPQNKEVGYMCIQVLLSTYDSARGFSLGRHSELLSVSNAELSARGTLPFLGASASRSMGAPFFFLPPRGES